MKSPMNDFQSHHMAVFKEFDDFSNKMFNQMDDNGMGFGSLMPRFSGFDDIERRMMDFSDCKQGVGEFVRVRHEWGDLKLS